MAHKLIVAGVVIFCLLSCKSENVWEEFEDPVFITYLHDNYDIPITENGHIDLDNDDTLRALGKITFLNINNINCISLKGINNLVSLTQLYCGGNRLTSLDVSYLDNLFELDCSNNYLKSINVSGCSDLEILYCNNNQIKKLKLEGCKHIMWLKCGKNQLKELDIRGRNSLNGISCVPQTDDKNNIQNLTIIMSPGMKQIWEESWAKWNQNANAIFKE